MSEYESNYIMMEVILSIDLTIKNDYMKGQTIINQNWGPKGK